MSGPADMTGLADLTDCDELVAASLGTIGTLRLASDETV
jgi:hypothetical protein